MKITVLYVSVGNHTAKAAEYIQEGIGQAGTGIEVKLMNLLDEDAPDNDFIAASSAVIIGSPTYFADMCWQLKKWFDIDRACPLAGKLGAAFATANFPQGGPHQAVSSIIRHMLVKGMLVYSSGISRGKPYIHLGPIGIADKLEESADLFRVFGQRVAEKVLELECR
ncbi:MAG: flavodoxin family protein [Clostridia bacterium]|nr:flavodoxin family protein [Clostridia bacterium]